MHPAKTNSFVICAKFFFQYHPSSYSPGPRVVSSPDHGAVSPEDEFDDVFFTMSSSNFIGVCPGCDKVCPNLVL